MLLERFIQSGKKVFLSGGAMGFDTLAAQSVLTLKRHHPEILLVLALPCRSQASRWPEEDRQVYRSLISEADRVQYISEEYFPGCMQKRNRFLVDHADTCLCYLTRCRGGTWNTVSYAYDCGRTIRNLAME